MVHSAPHGAPQRKGLNILQLFLPVPWSELEWTTSSWANTWTISVGCNIEVPATCSCSEWGHKRHVPPSTSVTWWQVSAAIHLEEHETGSWPRHLWVAGTSLWYDLHPVLRHLCPSASCPRKQRHHGWLSWHCGDLVLRWELPSQYPPIKVRPKP